MSGHVVDVTLDGRQHAAIRDGHFAQSNLQAARYVAVSDAAHAQHQFDGVAQSDNAALQGSAQYHGNSDQAGPGDSARSHPRAGVPVAPRFANFRQPRPRNSDLQPQVAPSAYGQPHYPPSITADIAYAAMFPNDAGNITNFHGFAQPQGAVAYFQPPVNDGDSQGMATSTDFGSQACLQNQRMGNSAAYAIYGAPVNASQQSDVRQLHAMLGPLRISASNPYTTSVGQSAPPGKAQPTVAVNVQREMILQDLLNTIPAPTVREVETRGALVCLSGPNARRIQVRSDEGGKKQVVNGRSEDSRNMAQAALAGNDNVVLEYEFEVERVRFEVRLGEGSSNKMKTVFCGEASEIKLEDLKPGTEYFVDVRAMLENTSGRYTEVVKFSTKADRPDAPDGLKLVQRGRNHLSLKWNAPRANGSKILAYIIEYAEGKQCDLDALALDNGGAEGETSGKLEQLECTATQQRVSKLQARSSYTVRVAARNALGTGAFSVVQTMATCGDAPERPDPPRLLEAGASWLKLSWQSKTDADEVNEFKLEVEDETTGHGFIPAYCGGESSYTVQSLRRNTEYRFRLAAANEVGTSRPSEPVAYRTLPEAPRAPTSLEQRGRSTHASANLRWSPPSDAGGLELAAYLLELRRKPVVQGGTKQAQKHPRVSASANDAEAATEWTVIYEGSKCEFQCTQLQPNSVYEVRVRALTQSDSANASGARFVSEPSAVLELITQPDLPGTCGAIRILGKPKPAALELRWSRPLYDGYAGNVPLSSQSSVDTELSYELEMHCEADARQDRLVYRGPQEECIVAGLTPGISYTFNVRARNVVGFGSWLPEPLRIETSASRPLCAPSELACELKHEGARWLIIASWQSVEGLDTGGQPIVEYVLECRKRKLAVAADDAAQHAAQSATQLEFEQVYRGPKTEFTLDNTQPHCLYELRVACANKLGVSPVSHIVEVRTAPGRPNTPARDVLVAKPLDESRVSLKWRVLTTEELNGGKVTGYRIEYRCKRSTSDRWTSVEYSRSTTECELDELAPSTTYEFRISVENEHGWSEPARPLQCRTLCEPPTRAPDRIMLESASCNSLRISWIAYESGATAIADIDDETESTETKATSKHAETTKEEYIYIVEMRQRIDVQQGAGSAGHYQVVFRGSETHARVQRLAEATDYEFRMRVENSRGISPFGESITFRTSIQQPGAVRSCGVRELQANGCVFEWSAAKLKTSGSELPQLFELQLALVSPNSTNRVLHTVYRGSDTRLVCVGLQANSTYLYRIRAVRVRSVGGASDDNAQQLIAGPFSPLNEVLTPRATSNAPNTNIQAAVQLLIRCGVTSRSAAVGFAVVNVSTERRALLVRACDSVATGENDSDELAKAASYGKVLEAAPDSEDESESVDDSAANDQLTWRVETDVLLAHSLALADLPLEQTETSSRRPARAKDNNQSNAPVARQKERSTQSTLSSNAAAQVVHTASRNRANVQKSSPSKVRASLVSRFLKRIRLLIGLEIDEEESDSTALRPEMRFVIFVTVLMLILAVAIAFVFAWYSSVLD